MHASSTSTPVRNTPVRPSRRWRVVDIVVASTLGVACGVLFWAWGVAWGPISLPFEALAPGAQAAPAALWIFAGVLGGLVIRKPGAALYTELLAATVSAMIGSQWGFLTLEAGLIQGLGAELVFLVFAYRRWGVPVAILAGAVAGLAMAINDLVLWYPGAAALFATIYVVSALLGGAVVGLLAAAAVRALAATGALQRFGAGRSMRVG